MDLGEVGWKMYLRYIWLNLGVGGGLLCVRC
jgi:hypothetical protein